ncbi:hypothetical protein AMECASPLE_003525 [Ameca splendens]|uniref:Uncharacterized protein n=1 Tax=Ameca splendens TaxID=208324 RepID=A0ABV0YKP1_9TELE
MCPCKALNFALEGILQQGQFLGAGIRTIRKFLHSERKTSVNKQREREQEEEGENAGDSPKPPTWDHRYLWRAQPMRVHFGGSFSRHRPIRERPAGRGDAR